MTLDTNSTLELDDVQNGAGLVARVIQVRGYPRPQDLLATSLRGNLVVRGPQP